MATLDAEDDVHNQPYDTRTAIRTVEYGVGSAECGCGGVCVAHPSSQAVAYTPQGSWTLALVPLAGSTISSMWTRCELHLAAFRGRIANGELRCNSRELAKSDT